MKYNRTKEDDYGTIAGFTFLAAFAFCLGMVITVAIVGVL